MLAGCSQGGPGHTAAAPGTGRTRAADPSSRIVEAAYPGPGRLVAVTIPGRTSGFRARPALVYLPPAAPARRLPVLELFHGTSGGPADWQSRGGLTRIADAFAARHGGRAPIIVLPDINGAKHVDTECVHAAVGDVERYLSVDVPAFVRAHYPAVTDRRGWTVGGLSEGGTCALMLLLRHPTTWGAAVDLSGLARPTVGDTDNLPRTVAELFGGSRAAYDRHDPLWLLAHRRYPGLRLWLQCGVADRQVRIDQGRVAAAARRAGMTVVAGTLPGTHAWTVWSAALTRALPWVWSHAG